MKKILRKRDIVMMLIFFSLILTSIFLFSNIRVNHTNSEPIGFYYLSEVKDLKRNDKVIIKQDRFLFENIENEKKDILKTIKGVAGDKITVKNHFIYINGENFGKILELENIEPFFKEGDEIIIPEGKYLLLGRSLLSYDSRYLGFFEKNEFVKKAKLLYEINKGQHEMREKSIAKILEMKDITNNITESIVLKKFNKDIENIGINKKSKNFGENN